MVSDITYLPLALGQWAYLYAFQDSFTRQVVGCRVLSTMSEELVTSALRQDLLAPGLVVHSDRGGQYCARAYRALLDQHGCLRSQSRRDECYDTARIESLWSRLKTEVLELRGRTVFTDLADAQVSIAEYFDYYNHERLHSSIDHHPPITLTNSFFDLVP